MNLFIINWWMLPAGVLVSMISGSIWYNPKTFFPTWWAGIGKTDETPAMENMGLVWGLTMASAALKTYFIGVALNAFAPALGGLSLGTGMGLGFVLWLGVIVPTYLTNHLFTGNTFKVYFIETGNHLIDYLIIAALFAVFS